MKRILSFVLLSMFVASAAFAASFGDGRKTVPTPGTAVALSATSQAYTMLTICAEADNTGVIAVGADPIADATTREGVYLTANGTAGDCFTDERQYDGDLSVIEIDSTIADEGVTFTWSRR